ncbi:MAG: Ig-like domain-containing protein, partial [Anaerolineales bacterium]|nr:Ig-like domain-containing protein [Anaerolineales bacterium]
MNTRRNVRYTLLLLGSILLLTSLFCSVGNLPFLNRNAAESGDSEEVEATPTPKPTNDVVIPEDAGEAALEVIWREPNSGQALALDGAVELTFNQPMDRATVEAAWQFLDPDGNPVSGTFNWPSPLTVRFTPTGELSTSTAYALVVDQRAASQEGKTLDEPLNLEIVTVGDLQVNQVFPADRTQEVESSAIITVMFNRPVVPLVIIEEQDTLPDPLEISPALSGQGKWLNTSVYVFEPDESLRSATTYEVKVAAGLTDTVGSQLAADFDWQFTTAEPTIDYFRLTDLVTDPDNYYIDVPLDQEFQVAFRQPMQPQSVESAFSLAAGDGSSVPVDFEWDEDDTVVTITPRQLLNLGTGYYMQITRDAQAVGGGGLRFGLDWNFTTVQPPSIIWTEPASGATQPEYNGRFVIHFASPMDLNTLKGKLSFEPELSGQNDFYYNEWDRSYNIYGLQPSTRYTVTIEPGMADVYGNQIQQGLTVTFTTGPLSPSANLRMPYDVVLYRADGPQDFYTSYVNVNTINYTLAEVSAKTFVGMVNYNISRWDYQPPQSDIIREWTVRTTGELNDQVLEGQTLHSSQSDPLAPGFYLLIIDSPDVRYADPYIENRLIVIADANLTFKATQSEALIWATDLTSGEPIANLPVTIYDQEFNPLTQGTTDGDGALYLDDVKEPFLAMTGEGNIFGFGALQWGSGVSPYDFGIESNFYSEPENYTAYVYTERPIYRPDQPVYYKGVVRYNDDLDYSLPQFGSVKVTITNYEETVYEGTAMLNEFGSFAGTFTLDANAVLGRYYIQVDTLDDVYIGGVEFSVAEYVRPEFLVDVTTEPADVLAGEDFTATIQADYYSGGSVAEAEVSWVLRAQDYTFSPGGRLSRYSFTDFDYDSGRYYFDYFSSGSGELIAEGEGVTDASGKLVVTLPADLSEENSSRTFTFEATVTDLTGTSVSGRADVTAHLSEVYAGVRAQQYVGTVGKEAGFDLVAVDWDAELLPGHTVDVEIVERRWSSVQVQDAQGFFSWETEVEEIPVATFEDVAMDADGFAEVAFTPPNGGVFKAIVTTEDAAGNENRASAFMWVAGEDYVPWRQNNDRSFDLISDSDSYEPGDTAEILIASPFQGRNYALVTVERGHIRQYFVEELTSNSTIFELPIDAEMAPNVYVSVLIIKGVDRADPKPDFKMGMIEINVATEQQTLNVEITPDKEQAGPGETVTYTVKTTDYQGEPVDAELSLG